jgi:hypothetical protein
MRVSELVKSFEDIASSPRSEPSRARSHLKHHDSVSKQENDRREHLVTDNERNVVETREPDAMSDVESNDDSSVVSGEARKVPSREVMQVKGVTKAEDERPVDIVVSNSSELTDEISVEVRMSAMTEKLSKDQEESTVDQHHGESDNPLNSQCSELTDEIDFDQTAAHEIEREFDNSQHQSQMENVEVSNHDTRVCSGGSDSPSRDETTFRVSYAHVNQSLVLDQKDEVSDPDQLRVVKQCTKKDSLIQHVDAESRDPVHSTSQDAIRHGKGTDERFVSDNCDWSIEKISSHEPPRGSVRSCVSEKGVTKLDTSEIATSFNRDDSINTSPENSNNRNVHELIKEMEMSMEERFRRLEETCEQIPLIMEQLQRHANEANHVPFSAFSPQSNDDPLPLEVPESIVPKLDQVLKTTSSESIENDVSIMTSFPELRAFVHQLESTSTNAIANVLREESIEADEQVLVDETPFDEAAVLDNDEAAPLSASMHSSELSESKSTELLSKEIESLTIGDENSYDHGGEASSSSSTSASSEIVELNVNETTSEIESSTMGVKRNDQSRPLDSVLPNCSNMMAVEVVQADPSEALHQVFTFLDEQHANFDRLCWGFICGGQFEYDE